MPVLLGEMPLVGAPIDARTVRQMVATYRVKNSKEPKTLKHAHYSVLEVLELLKANQVIDEETLNVICKRHPKIKNGEYGLKIYMGTHSVSEDCPNQDVRYIGYDAPILCNTELVLVGDGERSTRTNKRWEELLTDGLHSITYSDKDALDQSSLCPPDCDEDNDGNGMSDIHPY